MSLGVYPKPTRRRAMQTLFGGQLSPASSSDPKQKRKDRCADQRDRVAFVNRVWIAVACLMAIGWWARVGVMTVRWRRTAVGLMTVWRRRTGVGLVAIWRRRTSVGLVTVRRWRAGVGVVAIGRGTGVGLLAIRWWRTGVGRVAIGMVAAAVRPPATAATASPPAATATVADHGNALMEAVGAAEMGVAVDDIVDGGKGLCGCRFGARHMFLDDLGDAAAERLAVLHPVAPSRVIIGGGGGRLHEGCVRHFRGVVALEQAL